MNKTYILRSCQNVCDALDYFFDNWLLVYGTLEILPIATYNVPSVTKTVYLLLGESSCCLHLTIIKRMLLKLSNIVLDIKTITKRNKILSHYMGIMQLSACLNIY